MPMSFTLLYLSFTDRHGSNVIGGLKYTLMAQVNALFTKEIILSLVHHLAKVGVALIVGAALSGCVVRPLGWGDRGGHGRGDRHQVDPDRGRSPGYDHPRDQDRRRGP
jgi:hypothetical protein